MERRAKEKQKEKSMVPDNAVKILFGMPGSSEWIIILVIVVVLFGARKIPDLARGLGKGITEFKRGLKEPPETDADTKQLEDEEGPKTE